MQYLSRKMKAEDVAYGTRMNFSECSKSATGPRHPAIGNFYGITKVKYYSAINISMSSRQSDR